MKITIDTKSKTITLKETVNLEELMFFIQKSFGDLREWKIKQEVKFETITVKDTSDWYKPYKPLEVMYNGVTPKTDEAITNYIGSLVEKK